MGNFSGYSILSNGMNIFKFSAEISSAGGIVFGIGIFFILLIIAGFLIFNMLKNPSILDEDSNLGIQKGIVKASNK